MTATIAKTNVRIAARNGFVAAAAVLAVGCSMEPDYARPKMPMPGGWRNAEAVAELPRPPSEWWKTFRSETLTQLIEMALSNNRDLKAAVRRIQQAEAFAGITASPLLPTIQISAKDQLSGPSSGVTKVPVRADDRTSIRFYSLGATVNYEIDLWGKNRSAMNAALANAQASVFDRETVALTLVADVASTYFLFLSACARVAVAQGNVENMKSVLKTVERRAAIGEGTMLEVRQQKTILAQAEATLPIIQTLQAQSLNKLAVLTGLPPQELSFDCRQLDDLLIPEVGPGLPSELLLRRPDIRKAEAGLVAATANIGNARAKLFPSISLTGERGVGSPHLATLLSPNSIFFSLGVNIAATIFDNAKTLNEIAFAEARQAELVELYLQSILASLRDVEDALVAVRRTAEQELAQTEALENASAALNLSQSSYAIGMTDYLSVLESERAKHKSEEEKVLARLERLNASVALFKALGGGSEPFLGGTNL